MQFVGPISAEPEADVGSVVRSAEKRDGLGEQLRSLAHPGWPYTGTPWEWRGFVENRYQKLKFGSELT
jgi:hypothetical protein